MSEFKSPGISFVSDESNLESILSQGLSVLYFYASWNEADGAGAQISKIYENLSSRYGSNVSFLKIEAEEQETISIKYKVTVVPTFICLQGKKVISRVEGVNPPELNKAVSNLLELPKTIEASSSNLNPKLEDSSTMNNSLSKAVEERLIRLLSASPSLLFMKGTPDAPRCGFSRKIVELLRANEILFASFDILTDEEVRQGLKIYSDWPTYPQFYVNGDLIGGLDVLNEMAASGNLKSQLNLDEIPIISPVQSLDVRLKNLVNSSPIMIFIKGTPEEPRCGFSKSLVSILNSENIQFSYFDILTDEEVRQGLKVFSDWPTYPQIYSNGNLIGGLDIIKEMQSSGPLLSQLTQST